MNEIEFQAMLDKVKLPMPIVSAEGYNDGKVEMLSYAILMEAVDRNNIKTEPMEQQSTAKPYVMPKVDIVLPKLKKVIL